MPETIGSSKTPKIDSKGSAAAPRFTKGNAPRRWQDYLAYPRILFMVIMALVMFGMFVAFGIYVLFFEK